MRNKDRYPGIARAALEIALDNGGINRTRPVDQMLREFDRFIDRQPSDVLIPIDSWLSLLSDEQIRSVCSGAEPEDQVLLDAAPPFTDKLLNDYFDEVC